MPELFAALQEGDADALVTTYAPQHRSRQDAAAPGNSTNRTTSSSRPRTIGSLNRAGPCPLAKLVNEDWILPRRTRCCAEIGARSSAAPVLAPVPVVEANNPTTSIQLVGAGIGLGFAHRNTAERAPAPSPPSAYRPPRPARIALVYRAKRMNEKIQALRAALGL